jgi:hypothetical protein
LGQAHPVQVIHLLTEKSIEERVWETLELKKSLFAGVFDSPTAEVSFAKLGRKSALQAVKEIFTDQPRRPIPLIGSAPPQPIPVAAATAPTPAQSAETAATPSLTVAPGEAASGTSGVPGAGLSAFERAAAGLIEDGLVFIESMAVSRRKFAISAPWRHAASFIGAIFPRPTDKSSDFINPSARLGHRRTIGCSRHWLLAWFADLDALHFGAMEGPRVRIAANHAFGRRRVTDGKRESRYHEYKRYFINLKAVAALGFESSFELARTFPVCCGSVGLWAIPIFWSQTVTCPRGYARFATHRDPSPATLKIVSISLEEFATFDTFANQWCQLVAVANVELTDMDSPGNV